MPTWNRAAYIGLAIDSFLSQNYENKELVIVDNGNDGTESLIPKNRAIRYIKLPGGRRPTGEMRNRCCEAARGEVIIHFDSDDWSAADRIAEQVARLGESGKQITGYGQINFYDERDGKAYQFIPELKSYMMGTSLCYWREWWERGKFESVLSIGEDWRFVQRDLSQAIRSDGTDFVVARIHKHQTSVKAVNRSEYRPIPVEQLPPGFLSAIQCHK
jgi:glycosyltransferase involved in cell wall biosynthesis